MAGHNAASHLWFTNLFGDNMHSREYNSLNIAHVDAINYGRLSAIDRAIMTAGKHQPVAAAMTKSPVPAKVYVRTPTTHTADWGKFYTKYILSQAESKYDKTLSLSTEDRSNSLMSRDVHKLNPTKSTLLYPQDGQAIRYQ